jgi:hypothetical protein
MATSTQPSAAPEIKEVPGSHNDTASHAALSALDDSLVDNRNGETH